jgi:hypothetical protein
MSSGSIRGGIEPRQNGWSAGVIIVSGLAKEVPEPPNICLISITTMGHF